MQLLDEKNKLDQRMIPSAVDNTAKKIRCVYTSIFIVSTLYLMMLAAVEVFTAVGFSPHTIMIGDIMLAAVYFLDSVGLLVATYVLIKTLNDNFAGTTFQNETLILKVVFFIFTIGYVGQSIMFIFLCGIAGLN